MLRKIMSMFKSSGGSRGTTSGGSRGGSSGGVGAKIGNAVKSFFRSRKR